MKHQGKHQGRQSQSENPLVAAPTIKPPAKKKSWYSKAEILEYANACYATGKIKNLEKFIRHLESGKQDRSINFYLENGRLLYQD